MGGLGPGIGGMEYIVIAIVALLVLGPERLPVMLRKIGRWVAKARGMANEFRASFDEMARQSELDDLRKEVEALRQGQMVPLGAEADAAFKDIRDEMNKPLEGPKAQPALTGPDEWPDSSPVTTPPEPKPAPKPRKPRAATAKTRIVAMPAAKAAKPIARTEAVAKPVAKAQPAAKPRAVRKKAAES